MNLSANITMSNAMYNGERRIRLKYRLQAEKNISFSAPEWIALMLVLKEINDFFTSRKSNNGPAEKTWDLLRGNGGNKRVTVKRFESGFLIVDFRIFNFHVNPELPTKFGIALNENEWEKFTSCCQTMDEDWTKQDKMKESVKQVLRDMVTSKTKEHCHGCITNHPSQKQHMELGCLSSWEEQRDAYIEQCFYTLNPNHVLEHYSKATGDSQDHWKKLKLLYDDQSFKEECFQMSAELLS